MQGGERGGSSARHGFGWIGSINLNTVLSMAIPPRLVHAIALGVAALAGTLSTSTAEAQEVEERPIKLRNPAGDPVRVRQALKQSISPATNDLNLRAIRTAVVPDGVRVLVANLDDHRWFARQAAARQLERYSVSDNALLRVLEEDTLSEEQRQRLMEVLSRRILLRPRGAIGIRMNTRVGLPQMRMAGVEVTDVLPGLPAERVLKVGDVITRIDDADIRLTQDLITHVQRMPPGQVIAVTVLRPHVVPADGRPEPGWVQGEGDRWFETIDVEFALGSFEQLGETRAGLENPETRRRLEEVAAIRARWDRASVGFDGQSTVDGVVAPEESDRLRGPGSPGR